MTKILFVCHGNICRSPMAEFVFRDMVSKQGLSSAYEIASAATSTEEIGNRVHPGTTKMLKKVNISTAGKTARQIRKADYETYDYLVGMDQNNIRNMLRAFGSDPDNKITRLLDFSTRPRDIADPWYTGNFELTYQDVLEGCEALLNTIEGK